jgi:long-chain acyl-CoA synthetase
MTFSWLSEGRQLPTMRRESHFGDRIVQCFYPRSTSVWAMFCETGERFENDTALVCGTRRLSYAQLHYDALSVAAALKDRGLMPGDRVVMLIANRIEFVVVLLATQALSLISVPVSIREQAAGVQYVMDQSDASLLVIDEALLEKGLKIDDQLMITTEELTKQAFQHDPLEDIPAVLEEDTAVILYTSGTTGKPKGAMLTHFNIVHSALHFTHCMQWKPGSRTIMAVPASHVTGLVANILTAYSVGACVIVMPSFNAKAFLHLAAAERLTHTILVPAMYNLCLLEPDIDTLDLSHWQVGGFGGAAMPKSTIEALAQKLPGLQLQNAYGATETTSPTTCMPPHLTNARLDSVGLPLPCAEVLVMDETGQQVAAGEVGELWIGGPMVVKGYWDNPAATASEFTAGYWHSGDLGTIDADGFVRVLDRKKDMINRGGYKIYCVEIENLLMSVPGVLEAAVLPKPCPVLGERVVAMVYAPGLSAAQQNPAVQLQEVCKRQLADYKVPEQYLFSDSPLPRNANGKVMKRLLKTLMPKS